VDNTHAHTATYALVNKLSFGWREFCGTFRKKRKKMHPCERMPFGTACLLHVFKVLVLLLMFIMMTFVTYCIIAIYFSINEWTPFLLQARDIFLDKEVCYLTEPSTL
jgi:hypothetical protein